MSQDVISSLKKTNLPIVKQIPSIQKLLSEGPNLVLQAEPGAGKTTIVPLSLLSIIPVKQKILILEPRRLAARNAASRMAELLGEPVGKTVGYRIRNEVKVSNSTRIEVITEGILTRMLQSDPELVGIGLIIFDEFHERSLAADLGLAFSIEVQQSLRDDLKLLVMSATLDAQAISILLDNAPVINCEGQCYPVQIEYLPPKTGFDWLNALVTAIHQVLSNKPNSKNNSPASHLIAQDILVFLPGLAEIRKAKQRLEDLIATSAEKNDIVVLSLYGDLPLAQQRQVLLPIANQRKIILSTNIAETSVTIEGVGWVIDSGQMRQSVFDPNVGFNRLRTLNISQASATQRTGRAGRLGPGFCYRLWPQSTSLRKETLAEILREDLAGFALELSLWGVPQPSELKLFEQPNKGLFKQAQHLLQSLNAIDQNNKITSHGIKLSAIGMHPRIAHMLVESIKLGATEYACLLAALLEEKDLLYGDQRKNPEILARVNCLIDPQTNQSAYNPHVKKQIQKQSKILIKRMSQLTPKEAKYPAVKKLTITESLHLTAMLLAYAFPDRIAQKRGNGYRLSNGSGAISGESVLMDDDFLVVIKLGGTGRLAKIFQATGMSQNELEACFSEKFTLNEEVYWDEQKQSVRAERVKRFGELILDVKPLTNPNKSLVIEGLIQGIKKQGVASLPWNKELRQWQARVQLLRQFKEFESVYPDLSDEYLMNTMSQWLAPFLDGLNKLSQISSQLFSQSIKSRLDYKLKNQLEELMPSTIKVASGSNVPIDYTQGEKPILAVKLQEMFGEKQTPKLAGGRLSIVVHLLSPARRPLQITEDLASFWENGYLEVKKQMRGKYPKHPWPDNPLEATATRFVKKRTKK